MGAGATDGIKTAPTSLCLSEREPQKKAEEEADKDGTENKGGKKKRFKRLRGISFVLP